MRAGGARLAFAAGGAAPVAEIPGSGHGLRWAGGGRLLVEGYPLPYLVDLEEGTALRLAPKKAEDEDSDFDPTYFVPDARAAAGDTVAAADTDWRSGGSIVRVFSIRTSGGI
jgi:hypothetical protein